MLAEYFASGNAPKPNMHTDLHAFWQIGPEKRPGSVNWPLPLRRMQAEFRVLMHP